MNMMNNNNISGFQQNLSQNLSAQDQRLFSGNSPQLQSTSAGMMLPGMQGMSGSNSNQMTAMMNQMNQMNQMKNAGAAQQMNNMNMNMNMGQLNLNDLKRLQLLQQQQQQQQNNALLPLQQQQQDPSAALLQSLLGQKMQPFSMGSGGMAGKLLQANLMQNQGGLMGMGNAGGLAGNPGSLPLPSPHSVFNRDGSRRMRGGVIEPFPEKLHRLLMEVEAAGRSDVISFVANGRAFAIHKPDHFFKEIVPLYFRQSRLSSFKRQLNLYGFELINTGPARGGYFHELFIRDKPELCRRMRRVAVKVGVKKDAGDDDAAGDNSPPGSPKKNTAPLGGQLEKANKNLDDDNVEL